jgi:YidC/Oxa1 family membrane protein insertase
MVAFFHALLYTPIYNLLVLLIDLVPGGDAGIAVIGVTLIIRILIMPLSLAAIRTSRAMQVVKPELEAVKAAHKGDREGEAKATFAPYKQYGINPFAGVITLVIQLPVLICLYWVFRTAHLPAVDAALLYPFVHAPAAVSVMFLGLIALAGHSIVLAALAAVAQYLQARYAMPIPTAPKEDTSMQAEMGRAMAMQAKFVLPIVIGFVAYTSGAIALYFITTSLVTLAQELLMKRKPAPRAA